MLKKPIQITLIGILLVLHGIIQIQRLLAFVDKKYPGELIPNIFILLFAIVFIIFIVQFFRFKPLAINIALIYFILVTILGAIFAISHMIQLRNPKILILILLSALPNLLSIIFLIRKDTKKASREFDMERGNRKKLRT